jgi:hypothetical protein
MHAAELADRAQNRRAAGRDAGKIADEVVAHLAGRMGSEVMVTLEIGARIQAGARTTSCARSPRTAEP